MQNSFEKYRQYTASDFLLDEDFINSVLFPDQVNNAFWDRFILNCPEQKKNIAAAKNIIVSFDNSREKTPDEIKRRIWQSVILKAENDAVVRMKSRKVWMVAASILFVLVAGISYLYINRNENSEIRGNVTENTIRKNDIDPGGNNAVLTLANGSSIVLNNAQNGTLTQQGNAKVVKLNGGKLVYKKDKNIKLDALQYNTITTPRGGQYQLVFTDGSKVWLNAESSIRFPTSFSGKERDVEITGEAYFEVTHNADMPFHVKANNIDVAVLGTHFNINAYRDEGLIKTTLLEGSVKVSRGDKSVHIAPGQQALIADNIGNIEIKKNVDLEEIVSWKNGKFLFQNADIRSIMRQLERWYNISVSYEGNITDEEFVGDISRDVNISEILDMLEKTGAVKFETEGRKIIVK